MEYKVNGNGEFKISTEGRLVALEVKLEELASNHLPHIQERVDKVDKKLTWVLTTIVGATISIIILLVKIILG